MLIDAPASLVDDEWELHDGSGTGALRAAVVSTMSSGEGRRERAVEAFSQWLEDRAGPVGEPERRANAFMDVLMGDGAALTPEEAATRLAVSVRTLQRMTHRHVGLSPAAMIRRRRLQEAAQRVRENPETDLASIAAELGYADHAHLTRDFQAVLGIAPRMYRSQARG